MLWCFGWTPPREKGQAAQPRHRWRVNIRHALAEVSRELELWGHARLHEGVPLFSGGLLDSWPAWAVDALAIARVETQVIASHLASKEGGGRG